MGGAPGMASPRLILANPALSGFVTGFETGLAVHEYNGIEVGAAAVRDGLGVAVGASGDPGLVRAAIGASRDVLGFSAGLMGSVRELRGRARAWHAGIGLARNLGPLQAGVALTDITLNEDRRAPGGWLDDAAFRAHAGTQTLEIGPLDVAVAGHTAMQDGVWFSGTGVEVAYWPVTGRTFRVLAGIGSSLDMEGHLTVGGSFTGDWLTIEYARDRLSGEVAHRFGLRWR